MTRPFLQGPASGSSVHFTARKFRTVVESAEPAYIFDVLEHSNAFASADSNSCIRFWDKTTLAQQSARKAVESDENRLTGISKPQHQNDLLIYTTSKGEAHIVDVRTTSQGPGCTAVTFKGASNGRQGTAPVLCASSSSSGIYMACGTELQSHEAHIRVHDMRNPGVPMHSYTDAHSDDVSTLAFHPSSDNTLLTGSVDGLSSTIDVRISDEDDAIMHTANVGASLSKVGWTSLSNKSWGGCFALTNMETLSVYNAADEMTIVREFGDLRDISNTAWSSHYVIDCTSADEGLTVVAGTREGEVAILSAPLAGDWQLRYRLTTGGHRDIVRSCRASGSGFLSGGEDGQICLWNMPTMSKEDSDAMAVDDRLQDAIPTADGLKATRETKIKAARYAPY